MHNVANICAAATAVYDLVDKDDIKEVVTTFGGVEHRMELVRTINNVKWYNDSIGTSPSRTIAGLKSFNKKVILIAGGYDKNIPYEPLAPYILDKVSHLILIGKTATKIRNAVIKEAKKENINIDDSILDYIASNIISNIRELQGAINKVLSFSDFCNTEITLESAKKALVDIINPNMKRQITIDYIMETVADHFHITMKDLLSSKRNSNIVYPRHICMYLCRQLTNSTYEEIGSKIGNRHHSTILHGEEIIKKKLDEGDEESIKTIDVLTKKIDPQ